MTDTAHRADHTPGAAAARRTLPDPLPAEPLALFVDLLGEAMQRKTTPNPNAMTLATIDADGRPSARVVLCKHVEPDPGYLVFFTNYNSRKAKALEANPRAAAVFHWDALDHQIRVEGPVTRSPDAESDAYFRSRPWLSRVGAWASDQSAPIESRTALEQRLGRARERFKIPTDLGFFDDFAGAIERPPYWGGYRMWLDTVEVWFGAVGRLHDRAEWTRGITPETGDPAAFRPTGSWRVVRLQP